MQMILPIYMVEKHLTDDAPRVRRQSGQGLQFHTGLHRMILGFLLLCYYQALESSPLVVAYQSCLVIYYYSNEDYTRTETAD